MPPATEVVAVRVPLPDRVLALASLWQKLRGLSLPDCLNAAATPMIVCAIMLAGIAGLAVHDLHDSSPAMRPTPVAVNHWPAPIELDVAPSVPAVSSIKPEAIVIPESKPLPMVVLPPHSRAVTVPRGAMSHEAPPAAPGAAPKPAPVPPPVAIAPDLPAVFGSQTVIYTPPASSSTPASLPPRGGAQGAAPALADYQLASIAGPDLALIALSEAGETVVMPYRKGDRLPDGATITTIDAARHRVVTSAGTLGAR